MLNPMARKPRNSTKYFLVTECPNKEMRTIISTDISTPQENKNDFTIPLMNTQSVNVHSVMATNRNYKDKSMEMGRMTK